MLDSFDLLTKWSKGQFGFGHLKVKSIAFRREKSSCWHFCSEDPDLSIVNDMESEPADELKPDSMLNFHKGKLFRHHIYL